MPLGQSIEQWPSRGSIRYAAVVDHDGELVESLVASEIDGEAAAALAVSILRLASQLGNATSAGASETLVLEAKKAITIVSELPGRLILVVVAHPNRDLGQLLFDIRRHRMHLAGVD